MPVSKVDSRCFNLSQKVDEFLSLGNASRTNLTPPDFWREIVQSEDAVSSYIVCLIAKLIALDCDHGLKPLPQVYKDLVEMPVDYAKYKLWSVKPLPANCKSAALELQYAIITTIRHMKDCYGYTPNIHLRHMYLRWNLARNYSSNGGRKADEYEEKVISPFSVAQAKEIMQSPVGSPVRKAMSPSPFQSGSPSPEEEEVMLVHRLVDECCTNHHRAFFGALPPELCKLCTYTNATDCLSYIRLRDLTSRSPRLLRAAMTHILTMLRGEVTHSYGEKEVVLPLLHLFRELLTMMCPVDTVEVYKALMPFYMWPLSHSVYTRGVLDQIMQEGRARGATFRQRVLSEQDVGLRPAETKVRGHLVHMLVDTSHPLTRGDLLHEILTTHQEKSDQQAMQRLIIRNVCRAVDTEQDVVELERKLQHLSADTLKGFCLRALELMEKVGLSEGNDKQLKTETSQLHLDIVQHVESEEQRDSAVSCSSVSSESHFTEDNLSSFSLPAPYIHAHSLADAQYPTILAKMREVLLACRQKITPQEPRPAHSLTTNKNTIVEDVVLTHKKQLTSISGSSQTSLDSTGSSAVEPDNPAVQSDTDVSSKKSFNGVIPNGCVTNGSDHVTNGSDHVTNGSDHVTNGSDHVTNGSDHVTNGSDHVTDGSDHDRASIDSRKKPRPSSLHVLYADEFKNADSAQDTARSIDRVSIDRMSGDRISLTSEERGSDSGSGNFSPASSRRPGGSPGQLVRRQTCPSGMHAKRASILNAMSPSTRRYPKNSIGQMSGSGITGRPKSLQNRVNLSVSTQGNKVKIRRSSSSVHSSMKKRANMHTPLIPTPISSGCKLVKVLLAGNDRLVSHTAKAYAHLQIDEPNLLSGVELQFYHIPLSRASLIHSQFPELAQASLVGAHGQGSTAGGNPDLPEPMFEQVDLSGNDVHMGRFLGHMDSWYERNVMMATHHLLRLIPSDLPSSAQIPPIPERPTSPAAITQVASLGEATLASRTNLTPSRVLLDAVSNYTREANNRISINMYKLKMNIKNEKSHKLDYREMYMLHRLDVQRLSGKKAANRQVKTFEANVTMTQLSLDGGLIRSDLMELRDVWVIRASNVPRAGDSCVPNPEADCFEMTIIKALSEGGRFGTSKFRAGEEMQYHVCDLVIETRDKPFTVMVDSDTDVLLENVIRLEVLPAFVEQSSLAVAARLKEQKTEKKLHFPLMTYWPVDL